MNNMNRGLEVKQLELFLTLAVLLHWNDAALYTNLSEL